MKFGGTSVGKPERMQQVAQLILRDDDPKIVVLSAVYLPERATDLKSSYLFL